MKRENRRMKRKSINMFDLYLVADESFSLGRDILEVTEQAVRGGVTMVQLREKNADIRTFLEKAHTMHDLLKKYHIPLIINDRVDIALAVEAEGVHVGQSDMPVEYVKRIIPENMIIGLSVESMEQALEAERLEVDYLGVSPIFTTPTKPELIRGWGIEGLHQLRAKSRHKLIAIGGINQSNAASVIKAGSDGLAVVSAICSARNPEVASKQIRNIILQNKK